MNGIWMSYNDRIINNELTYTGDTSGVILDFDKSEIGYASFDTLIPIAIDYNEIHLKFKSDTLKTEFKKFGKDSIEVELSKNTMSIFHPLDLSNVIEADKEDIESFLINNTFGSLGENLDLLFTDEYFSRGVRSETTKKRKALINKSWDDEGYWHINKIRDNYFLILTIDQTSDKNIYQIISFDKCKMELKQLQESESGGLKISELKTCL